MSSELPSAYFDTVFTLGEIAVQAHDSFAIVTAFNPMDELLSAEENHAADQDLRTRLRDSGIEAFRVIGSSPDLSHSEPGWAISTSIGTALEIAHEFRQRAIWWIEDGELHLVECSNPELIHIARFSDRLLNP